MAAMAGGRGKRWVLADPRSEARALADALRVHPVVGQVLAQRGVTEPAAAERFFNPSLANLHDPKLMPGCERAAQRIVDALRHDEPIVIYGDYDVDGVTAVAILHHTLLTCQPDAKVQRYIPHRIDEGYGLNAESLSKLIDGGAKLIVSVDCGITASEAAAAVKQRDVDLIITDHHEMLPDGALPDCHTIVHPRLHEADETIDVAYPFGDPCGAGVAYKLAWQICRTWCGSELVPDQYKQLLLNMLSLAALGTVADVVPLVDENRTIVRYGLGAIKHTPYEGLNALIDASRLRDEKIDAYHVGFVLGPKLNACGRMGHAREACKLLTTAKGQEAVDLAAMLENANETRRTTERKIADEAAQMVRDAKYDSDDVRAIVLANAGWHPGVIGIVCSRLVEQFGRPVILLNTDNGIAQGSGRSIDGFDLHGALAACADHLTTWGGHAMAAGLKVAGDKVDAFRDAMIAHAAQHITVEQLTPTLRLDGEVALDEFDVAMIDQLDRLAPFGRSNARPILLMRDVEIAQPPKAVGAEGRHLVLSVKSGAAYTRGIAWRAGEWATKLAVGQRLDLAVQPKINEWQGRRKPEVVIEDWQVRN